MQVRRVSLVLVVLGLITLLVIGAINLASQDNEEPVSAPPAAEQPADNQPVAPENSQPESQPAPNNQTVANTTGDLPRTGPEGFITPVAIAGVILITSTYMRSRQSVRRSLLSQ